MTKQDIQIGKMYRVISKDTGEKWYLIPTKKVKHPKLPSYDSLYAATPDYPDLKRNFSIQWLIENGIELVEGYEE